MLETLGRRFIAPEGRAPLSDIADSGQERNTY